MRLNWSAARSRPARPIAARCSPLICARRRIAAAMASGFLGATMIPHSDLHEAELVRGAITAGTAHRGALLAAHLCQTEDCGGHGVGIPGRDHDPAFRSA